MQEASLKNAVGGLLFTAAVFGSLVFGMASVAYQKSHYIPLSVSHSGPKEGERKVVAYHVEGQGSAGITYSNGTGGTEQVKVTLPWDHNIYAYSTVFGYISAQKQNDDSSEIKVKISVNGDTEKESVSSSPYGIATASGNF